MDFYIRDELITVPEYIVNKIPFLQTLKSTIQEDKTPENLAQEKSSRILTINSLSPRLFKIIIDYSKNDYKIYLLMRLLYEQFANDIIKQNLGYLCLEELYNNLHLQCLEYWQMEK